MQYSCTPLNINPLNGVSRKETMDNDPTKRKVSFQNTRYMYVTIARYSLLIIPKWSTTNAYLAVE
jgi:hypothetical protein